MFLSFFFKSGKQNYYKICYKIVHQMQRIRMNGSASKKNSYFSDQMQFIFGESRYAQQKNSFGLDPNPYKKGHKILKTSLKKKIKSEAQSPEHGQASSRDSSTYRKSVNLKTENQIVFTERKHIKNSINAILDRKFHGGTKAALSNHSPEKLIFRTTGLLNPDSEKIQSKTKIKSRQIIMRSESKDKAEKKVEEISDLTEFEVEEIKKFPVFFKGKRRISSKKEFTDNQGNSIVHKGDSIAYRYQILDVLGKGAFGKVFRAYDHKKKEMVALKIIKSIPKLNQQAKIEIQILEKACKNDEQGRNNIVKMKGSFIFRGHACISYEVLAKNLYEYIKDSNFKPTPEKIIVKFAIQILHSLLFLSENNVVHCDIKPQNIMLKQPNKTGLRVIDMGSSCFEQDQFYTYIQSRFYRAPEIIMGIRYTPAIDMWSFGLVIVELFTGFPLFPGESEEEQLSMYMEVLGMPPLTMIEKGIRRKKFFNDNFEWKGKQKLKASNGNQLHSLLNKPAPSPALLDLISRCLEWNPQKRIKPKQAILHEWILHGIPEGIRARHIQQVQGETHQA